MTPLTKANSSLGPAYRFRGSVHYCHGRKHADLWADIMLQKELRVLYFDPQAAKGGCPTRPTVSIGDFKAPASTVTGFLQQGHTS